MARRLRFRSRGPGKRLPPSRAAASGVWRRRSTPSTGSRPCFARSSEAAPCSSRAARHAPSCAGFPRADGAPRSVLATTSGYTGGSVQRPTYLQTCTGTTGHAEAVQVLYDTSKVTYQQLLDVFWCVPYGAAPKQRRAALTARRCSAAERQAQHQPNDAEPAVRGPRAAVPQRRVLPHARAKGGRGAWRLSPVRGSPPHSVPPRRRRRATRCKSPASSARACPW